jgi:hypothetical protein
MSSAQSPRSLSSLVSLGARILTSAGVALLALAAVFALHTWLTTRSLVRATAVVSENAATQDANGIVSYTSRLRFRTASGEAVIVDDPHHSTDADDPDYVTGAAVSVAYLVGHPEQARVATVWRLYHAACIAAIWGTVIFDVGLVVLLILKRYRAGNF